MRTRFLSLHRVLGLVLVGAGLLSSTTGRAGPNDVDLTGLIDKTTGEPRNEDFRLLTQEMAIVFTPTSMQPAETTGQAGFDFGIEYAAHDISEQQPYWADVAAGRRQNRDLFAVLQTLGVRGRKGFILPVPLTSEIELGATWLVDSSLVNLGGNVRLALNEGFMWIPDIAVMAGINNVLGADELQLVTVTAGGSVSKGFGLAGSVNLCPFVSYQSIFYNASTKVIDPDPRNTSDVGENIVFDEVPIDDFQNRVDRISVGARLNVAVVQITAGADFNLIPDGANEPRLLTQFGARVGLLF